MEIKSVQSRREGIRPRELVVVKISENMGEVRLKLVGRVRC